MMAHPVLFAHSAGHTQLRVAEIHHRPASAPGQAHRFGHFAVQPVAAHGPRVFFRYHQFAVAQKRAVGRQPELVIALEGLGIVTLDPAAAREFCRSGLR